MATEQNESSDWLSDCKSGSFEEHDPSKDDSTQSLVELAKYKGDSFLEPGKSLEGFIIESRISRTDFFEIWKADHPRYGSSVIKTPYPAIIADFKAGKEVRKRMVAEAIALERMDHPNVVKIHQRDVHRTDPYLALEYVPGISLSCLMPRPGDKEHSGHDHPRLTYSESIDIAVFVLGALGHIHSKDVLHLDLKPGNIMIRFDNGRPHPVVIDFNACRLPDEFSWLGLADSDPLITMQYMAPEQPTCPFSDLTFQTDLYPVAKMLNEMLTGKMMAPEEPLYSSQEQVAFYQSLSYNQSFPEYMDPLLEPHKQNLSRSLLYMPSDRHETALAFRQDLENVRSMLRVAEDRLLEQSMTTIYAASLVDTLMDRNDRGASTTKRHRGEYMPCTSSFYKQDTESANTDLLQLV